MISVVPHNYRKNAGLVSRLIYTSIKAIGLQPITKVTKLPGAMINWSFMQRAPVNVKFPVAVFYTTVVPLSGQAANI